MGAKQLEALHETVTKTALIGFLGNPANPNAETDKKNVLAAAEVLGQRLLILPARNDDELNTAFATLAEHGAGALVVGADFFLSAGATSLSSWRHSKKYRRSIRFANSRQPVV